jgi:hypothetical protein
LLQLGKRRSQKELMVPQKGMGEAQASTIAAIMELGGAIDRNAKRSSKNTYVVTMHLKLCNLWRVTP